MNSLGIYLSVSVAFPCLPMMPNSELSQECRPYFRGAPGNAEGNRCDCRCIFPYLTPYLKLKLRKRPLFSNEVLTHSHIWTLTPESRQKTYTYMTDKRQFLNLAPCPRTSAVLVYSIVGKATVRSWGCSWVGRVFV